MDASDAEKFDGILLNVAQQAGSIENILDTFFGFLQRKTDFFTGSQDEAAAEQMVMKYYKKHWKAGQKRREKIKKRTALPMRSARSVRKKKRKKMKRNTKRDKLNLRRRRKKLLRLRR